jgi:hypothetical protein
MSQLGDDHLRCAWWHGYILVTPVSEARFLDSGASHPRYLFFSIFQLSCYFMMRFFIMFKKTGKPVWLAVICVFVFFQSTVFGKSVFEISDDPDDGEGELYSPSTNAVTLPNGHHQKVCHEF